MMKKIKINIITEGGRSIGFGHITRCVALGQAFEEKGLRPVFLINGDETVESFVKDKCYKISSWLGRNDDPAYFIKDADIVVVDSYLLGRKFYDMIAQAARVPVYIDDNKRMDYPRGMVINGNIFANDLDYPKKEGVTYFLGTSYTPLRKPFWKLPPKKCGKAIERIMVTMGGDDSKGLTPKVLSLLQRIFPDAKKDVVIGSASLAAGDIEKKKDVNTTLFYNLQAEAMKNLMMKADIAVSAGGQTLYELARVGVPTVAVCAARNQLNNIIKWQESGFLNYAGPWDAKGLLKKIGDSIESLHSPNIRTKKAMKGREIMDGFGSRRIVAEVLRYA